MTFCVTAAGRRFRSILPLVDTSESVCKYSSITHHRTRTQQCARMCTRRLRNDLGEKSRMLNDLQCIYDVVQRPDPGRKEDADLCGNDVPIIIIITIIYNASLTFTSLITLLTVTWRRRIVGIIYRSHEDATMCVLYYSSEREKNRSRRGWQIENSIRRYNIPGIHLYERWTGERDFITLYTYTYQDSTGPERPGLADRTTRVLGKRGYRLAIFRKKKTHSATGHTYNNMHIKRVRRKCVHNPPTRLKIIIVFLPIVSPVYVAYTIAV